MIAKYAYIHLLMLHDKPSTTTGYAYEPFVSTTIVNGISVSCGVNVTEN